VPAAARTPLLRPFGEAFDVGTAGGGILFKDAVKYLFQIRLKYPHERRFTAA
jgi:hypothetical protein